jgi:glycerol-3-phosphate acyltransferase PlsY
MTVATLALLVFAYLLGSIPTAYLIGRWCKGIDLRQYGSGTISGSMVWEHVGRLAIIPVGLLDLGKVALPTWLGLYLGMGTPVAIAAGLSAVVGHNWPIYLHFTGGRGLGGYIAIFLLVYPWGALWMIVFLFIGWRLGDSAPWALASLLTLPLLSYILDAPPELYLTVTLMLLLALAKRLEANRRPLPASGTERRRVILRRLIFDRDITSHQEWIRRQPGN